MKTICQHWHTMLVAGKTDLPYKQLQSDRGFLVYVTNAYPAMKPYLKGFHLSLDLWRGDRDAEGWTVNRANATDDNENLPSQDKDEEEEGRSVNKRFVSSTGPPSGVTQAAPRFITDLESLLILSASPTPVKGVVRRRQRDRHSDIRFWRCVLRRFWCIGWFGGGHSRKIRNLGLGCKLLD
jgi:hypothetical protein